MVPCSKQHVDCAAPARVPAPSRRDVQEDTIRHQRHYRVPTLAVSRDCGDHLTSCTAWPLLESLQEYEAWVTRRVMHIYVYVPYLRMGLPWRVAASSSCLFGQYLVF
eukprot:6881491-Prymnesium_polylepis.1